MGSSVVFGRVLCRVLCVVSVFVVCVLISDLSVSVQVSNDRWCLDRVCDHMTGYYFWI